MVFLPFYLPKSSLLTNSRAGAWVLLAWILGQVRLLLFFCDFIADEHIGRVAAARLDLRIPGLECFRTRSLLSKRSILLRQYCSPRYHHTRYQGTDNDGGIPTKDQSHMIDWLCRHVTGPVYDSGIVMLH